MGGSAATVPGQITPAAGGRGIHAVHFYLDGDHFRLMASRFLAEAHAAGARVLCHLPSSLERLALHAAADLGAAERWVVAPLAEAWPAPQPLAATERHIRRDHRAALAAGFRGLRLLIDCPSMAPHLGTWRRMERLYDRLCDELPIVILCVFPLIREYEQVRDEIWAHHPYCYREGRFWRSAADAHACRPQRDPLESVSDVGIDALAPRDPVAAAKAGAGPVAGPGELDLDRRIQGLRLDLRREVADCGSYTDRRVVAAAARLESAVLQWLRQRTAGADIAVGEGRA